MTKKGLSQATLSEIEDSAKGIPDMYGIFFFLKVCGDSDSDDTLWPK